LYDFPETAKFLTVKERDWAIHRLKYQGSIKSSRLITENETFKWKFIVDALTDWQLYVSLFVYWGVVCPLYGVNLFLPTIINDLGYKETMAQLLTMPIYITAAGFSIVICFFSDRAAKSNRSRSPYVFRPMVALLLGFVMAIVSSANGHAPRTSYAGMFIAACGLYSAGPGNIAWILNNLAGNYKMSAGMAFQIGFGNLGGTSEFLECSSRDFNPS
jgi:hypothetical protein